MIEISEQDKALIAAIQNGLPLVSRPFAQIGEQLGLEEQQVIDRLQALKTNQRPPPRAIAPASTSRFATSSRSAGVWPSSATASVNLNILRCVISAHDDCHSGATICSA